MTGIQELFRSARVSRIKNIPRREIPRDFRFSTFSFLVTAAEQMNLGNPIGLVALQNKIAAMQGENSQ